jgi:Domain of unknown function (DUF2804), C-terminal
VWIDGEPHEPPPSTFRASGVDDLTFAEEAVRERRDSLLIVRSRYRQPFGTFSGALPGNNHRLEKGYGVMETHEAWW